MRMLTLLALAALLLAFTPKPAPAHAAANNCCTPGAACCDGSSCCH